METTEATHTYELGQWLIGEPTVTFRQDEKLIFEGLPSDLVMKHWKLLPELTPDSFTRLVVCWKAEVEYFTEQRERDAQ
ncbi:MAG: hypothetical protein ACYDDP_05975 [Acidithiobacillus sp.]